MIETILREHKLCYLATPYTAYAYGLDAAHVRACEITAELMRQGVRVYSPIAYGHSVSTHGKLDPLDHTLWLAFDEAVMDVCDALIVASCMPGWDTSRGISYEIRHFCQAGKPVYYLDAIAIKTETSTDVVRTLRPITVSCTIGTGISFATDDNPGCG